MYFRRKTNPRSFDVYSYLIENWRNSNNSIHEDFDIYSTLQDAEADIDAWLSCNFVESSRFPESCSPTVEDCLQNDPNSAADENAEDGGQETGAVSDVKYSVLDYRRPYI